MKFKVFLGTLYDDLVNRNIIKETEKTHDLNEKIERLNKYLERLKRIQEKEELKNKIKILYYDRYIIKEENIPDSYWHFLEKKYLDQGYGKFNLVEPQNTSDKELRKGHIRQITNEQLDSIDNWLNYFFSPDSDYLPMWAKVWSFQGMLKIGNLNEEKTAYQRRSKTAINPFVNIDSELLGKSVEYLKAYLNGEELEEEIKEKIKNKNFAQIYGYLLANKKEIKIKGNDGIWIKYLQERKEEIEEKNTKGQVPNSLKLYQSLQGYNTGWCTAASKETAKDQLTNGDFYVYYTKNENGDYVIPRIAIRMEENTIGEIRGIAANQNLESDMEKGLKEKLEEFPDKDKYLKKVRDMESLTKIYNEYKIRKLTKEELRFLYEIDEKILGFGYQEDPRITEILSTRDLRADLANVFDCRKDQISVTNEEALSEDIIYHHGDVILNSITSLKEVTFPKTIEGSLILSSVTSLKGVTFPETIGGTLYLNSVTSLKGVTFPKTIGKDLDLSSVTSLKGVTFPETIKGSLYLNSVTSLKEVTLPKTVVSYLDLSSLINLERVTLPEIVGDLDFGALTNLEEVILPKTIKGYLDLRSVTKLKKVTFPETIEGDLYLNSVTSLKEVTFPKTIEIDLDLRSVTSLDGINLPETIGENLILSSLTIERLLDTKLPKFKKIVLANNITYTYEEAQSKITELKLAKIKNEKEVLLNKQQDLAEIKNREKRQASEDRLKR